MTDEADVAMPPWVRVRKALGHVRRRFSFDIFDVFTRAASADEGAGSDGDYTLRWGSADEVDRCDPLHTELDDFERATGVARLAIGHRVVLALHDGTTVFSMWVNPRNLNVPGVVKRKLAEDQWFIYKAYTSPDHRGRKLYQRGMRFVLDAMAREGLRELIGYAHVKKNVSRKGLARLEFGTAGRMRAIGVPGWKHTFVSRELARNFPVAVARSNSLAKVRA